MFNMPPGFLKKFTPPPPPVGTTEILLHFDGTNGSTTFTDEVGHTVTANGAAQLSTARQKFGTASGIFNGTSSYLTVPHSSDFNLATGDFTIEMFIWVNAYSSSNMTLFEKDGVSGASFPQYEMRIDNTGKLTFSLGTGNGTGANQNMGGGAGTTAVGTGAWHHVAITRAGTTVRGFVDGNLDWTAVSTNSVIDGGKPLFIGYQNGQPSSSFFNGNIDELRLTKGAAIYTANFTPPSAPFTYP